jgi:hypothetical protein
MFLSKQKIRPMKKIAIFIVMLLGLLIFKANAQYGGQNLDSV